MTVFWDVAQCSLVKTDRRFLGVYCLHHQGDESHRSTFHCSSSHSSPWRQAYIIPLSSTTRLQPFYRSGLLSLPRPVRSNPFKYIIDLKFRTCVGIYFFV
jgi:hypothetical protein